MKHLRAAIIAILLVTTAVWAQVPQLINYQGRVIVDGVNFDGQGQFKFALVNSAGNTTYWSNDGTSIAGSEPTAAVTLTVTRGLYAVLLGDTTQPNMTIVSATVFTNPDVHLRVWFNDNTHGFQQLAPDRRIAAVGYAMMAADVPDGVITASKIAPGAVGSSQLASGLTLAGTTTGTFVGNVTGNITGSASNFTGILAGDVTGTQEATAIAASIVTGKTLSGLTAVPGVITSSDSILSAIGKLSGNSGLLAPLSSPTFTGTVTLPLGTATSPPLILQAGSNLTSPLYGAVEFDGTNVHVTNNSATPTRKTVAYTDTPINASQIGTGLITSSMMAAGSAASNLAASGQTGVPSGGIVMSLSGNDTNLIGLGYASIGKSDLGETFEQRPSSGTAPSARANHAAVWTGTEMIIWGGRDTVPLNSGKRYNPATNVWTEMTTTNAPTPRGNASAVWTGSEMIIWGGNIGGGNWTSTGGRYNPSTDTWASISNTGAPTLRLQNTVVWTGTDMIVWGGEDVNTSVRMNDGFRYTPTTDSWSQISPIGAPSARYNHTAVWTGTEMIVWGGGDFGSLNNNDGGRYNPATNSWSDINTGSAPMPRVSHLAVWTGSEMIIWGGYRSGSGYLNSGSRYNPTTDSWIPLPSAGAPEGRIQSVAVWTGNELIVWGGYNGSWFNDGGICRPDSNRWRIMEMPFSPPSRSGHTAVWTGREMIIWGGNAGSTVFGDTFTYSPPKEVYLYQRP
ncbi:MAG: hypothetical protein JNJ83_16370 [Verrucomicrobiaceae bacterium]|nr:hypothetical protein [Verrucomicrobiaceae bacterium]